MKNGELLIWLIALGVYIGANSIWIYNSTSDIEAAIVVIPELLIMTFICIRIGWLFGNKKMQKPRYRRYVQEDTHTIGITSGPLPEGAEWDGQEYTDTRCQKRFKKWKYSNDPLELFIILSCLAIMMVSLINIMENDGGWVWIGLIYLMLSITTIHDYWRIKKWQPGKFTRKQLIFSSAIAIIGLIFMTIVLAWEVMN